MLPPCSEWPKPRRQVKPGRHDGPWGQAEMLRRILLQATTSSCARVFGPCCMSSCACQRTHWERCRKTPSMWQIIVGVSGFGHLIATQKLGRRPRVKKDPSEADCMCDRLHRRRNGLASKPACEGAPPAALRDPTDNLDPGLITDGLHRLTTGCMWRSFHRTDVSCARAGTQLQSTIALATAASMREHDTFLCAGVLPRHCPTEHLATHFAVRKHVPNTLPCDHKRQDATAKRTLARQQRGATFLAFAHPSVRHKCDRAKSAFKNEEPPSHPKIPFRPQESQLLGSCALCCRAALACSFLRVRRPSTAIALGSDCPYFPHPSPKTTWRRATIYKLRHDKRSSSH